MSANEAEKVFWRTPELVDRLLPFLDPASTLALAQVLPLTAGLLQATHNWSRFIRRFCPFSPSKHNENYKPSIAKQKLAEVRPLVRILQMMESPQFNLVALLDIICERFPPSVAQHVMVTCPNHNVHHVSPLGLVLLQFVETACANASSEQDPEPVDIDNINDPLISALKAWMMHQGGWLSGQVKIYAFTLKTQNDAEDFLALAENAEKIGFRRLTIGGGIGERGWAALAEALRMLPPLIPHSYDDGRGFRSLVVGGRQMVLEGRREDVKAVWDALPGGSYLLVQDGEMDFTKDSDEDWQRLELYLGPGEVVITAEDWDWEPDN